MPLLDLCIKIDWKFLDAHLEKGQIWFDQKEYNKALEAYRMAATVTNTNPDAYFWMGRCYEALKDKEQARENYERALSLDKSFYQAEEDWKDWVKNKLSGNLPKPASAITFAAINGSTTKYLYHADHSTVSPVCQLPEP
ncbi:MAG: tetratricopeptide repeat protein [Chitinophagaceae bacterium]|nr:tetratricopeptide repeat protein [Chitinophagaceae bacterium]